MADVNKINVNGTDYDIADADARDDITEIKNDLSDLDVLGVKEYGTSIPSGADLNTYFTPGRYYCGNASRAAEITNSPVTNAGYVLLVFMAQNSTERDFQFIFDAYNNRAFYRSYINSTSNMRWYDWQQMTSQEKLDAVQTEINNTLTELQSEIDDIGEVSTSTIDSWFD